MQLRTNPRANPRTDRSGRAAKRAAGLAVVVASVTAMGLSSGCASRSPEVERDLTLAQNAIQQAEAEEARGLATADLNRATDKYEKARNAFREDRFARAEMLAEQARVDAEYAEATARAAKAANAASAIDETIQTLESEINRPVPGIR